MKSRHGFANKGESEMINKHYVLWEFVFVLGYFFMFQNSILAVYNIFNHVFFALFVLYYLFFTVWHWIEKDIKRRLNQEWRKSREAII